MTTHSIFKTLPLAMALGLTAIASQAQPMATASGAGMNPMTAGALGAADRKFIDNAAVGGMAEVAAGQMAQDKAGSDAVKQFAKHMVDDHGKANGELMQLASSKGVTPPTALDKKHKLMADKLSKLTGAAFDREYMKGQVADHKDTVALFEKEAASGSNEEVKSWAAKTLPTLKDHLKMAQDLAGSTSKMASK